MSRWELGLGLHDLGPVAWLGDSFEQIAKFRDRWQHVLDNIVPGVSFQEYLMTEVLRDRLKTSTTHISRTI